MVRTQVQFREEQIEALRREAARGNVSVSEVVRRAVDAWLEADPAPSNEERKRRAIDAAGRFGSGRGDVAARHDEHLAEIYRG